MPYHLPAGGGSGDSMRGTFTSSGCVGGGPITRDDSSKHGAIFRSACTASISSRSIGNRTGGQVRELTDADVSSGYRGSSNRVVSLPIFSQHDRRAGLQGDRCRGKRAFVSLPEGTVFGPHRSLGRLPAKRMVDLVLGGLGLVVAAPAMTVIACLVRLDSKGAAFAGARGPRWGYVSHPQVPHPSR